MNNNVSIEKQIEDKIKEKFPNISNELLYYYKNYFVVAHKKNVIPDVTSFDDLLNNLSKIKDIIFFEDDSEIAKKYGPDFKGICDTDTGILYIRNSLSPVLKEKTIYHEMHHAIQYWQGNYFAGIHIGLDFGNLINEAQTQWFAEEVYNSVHNVEASEKEYKSEDMRMLPGSTIVSSLDNYQMYDAMLTKLAIIMDVPKDFFVKISYYKDQKKAIEILKNKYESSVDETFYDFNNMMYALDYALIIDRSIYTNTTTIYDGNLRKLLFEDKKETKFAYDNSLLYPKNNYIRETLSLEKQKSKIYNFDYYAIKILSNKNIEAAREYAKYIFDDQLREKVYKDIENKKQEKRK